MKNIMNILTIELTMLPDVQTIGAAIEKHTFLTKHGSTVVLLF